MFYPMLQLLAQANSDITIKDLINKFIEGILNPLITLLFILATVVFLWGVIQYVIGQAGDEKKIAEGKRVMAWGMAGLFIMVSAWGIVAALCNFFGTCLGINFP